MISQWLLYSNNYDSGQIIAMTVDYPVRTRNLIFLWCQKWQRMPTTYNIQLNWNGMLHQWNTIYLYILMCEMIWSIYFCAHPVFLLLRSAVVLTIAGGLMHILYSIIAIMQFGLEGFKVSFNVRNNLWLNWNTSSSYIVFHLCVIPF